jgi:bis(5'-nucleosyl)-tetraphosphatase (symmetrical)
VTRYAIGDVQGCYEELRALVARLKFSSDRDQLWFVGDLVNRGPKSVEVLRYVRSLGENALVVLGNHDLHLLALSFGKRRKRKSDTLDDILDAPDRQQLLEWLIARPLAHFDAANRDLLVHAGVVPQWTVETTCRLAAEVQAALRGNPTAVFDHMYGDEPDRWSEALTGTDRTRFVINVLTRLRVCTSEGQIDLKMKGKPEGADAGYRPWFEVEGRRTGDVRVVFGHWSALGLVLKPGLAGLDTGCVWGSSLTALDLDGRGAEPVSVLCSGYQAPDDA